MLMDAGDLVEPSGEARRYYAWAGRLRTEYGTNFSQLNWLDSQLLIETSPRLGLDADWR